MKHLFRFVRMAELRERLGSRKGGPWIRGHQIEHAARKAIHTRRASDPFGFRLKSEMDRAAKHFWMGARRAEYEVHEAAGRIVVVRAQCNRCKIRERRRVKASREHIFPRGSSSIEVPLLGEHHALFGAEERIRWML